MPTAATWDSLPDALKLRIFDELSLFVWLVGMRVSRRWRTVLSSAADWTRLDLSFERCEACRASDEALLRGFAAKATGTVTFLNVCGRDNLPVQALLEVVAANAVTLQNLRATSLVMRTHLRNDVYNPNGYITYCDAAALLKAAPSMTLRAPVRCGAAQHMRTGQGANATMTPAAVLLLNNQAPFERLCMSGLSLIQSIRCQGRLFVWATAHLAGLTSIAWGANQPPMDECIPPLAAALAQNSTLTWLSIDTGLLFKPPAALALVLTALTSHPSLRVLELELAEKRILQHGAEVMVALCALVEADAPALRGLHILGITLSDAETQPLMAALANNTHLRDVSLGTLDE